MNKKIILAFILGVLASGTIVYALSASDINYKDGKKVDEALNDLYGKVNGPSNGDIGIGGVVYLDPTDLSKSCNSSNSISTTGIKTGCMKWYVYDNDGDKYKLILDHNTDATIKWNDERINVSYENSNIKPEIDKLVSESKWVAIPRLITAEEVNEITGKTGWKNSSSMYCLDSRTQDRSSTPQCDPTGKLGWLYDNVYCQVDKCINLDKSTNGYWVNSVFGTVNTGNYVWHIGVYSDFSAYSANDPYVGIRPVIEIEKNKIK